jgi:hypothetical protein
MSDSVHEALDAWTEYFIVIRLAVELEKGLGLSDFDDHDLEGVHSLLDLSALVEKKIEGPGILDRHAVASDAINAAVLTLFPAVNLPSFEARLIDVFRPYLPTP